LHKYKNMDEEKDLSLPTGQSPVGGRRPGAGRKPKADEQELIEIMKKHGDDEQAIKILWGNVMAEKEWAIKLWIAYRWGQPTQIIAQESRVNTKIEIIRSNVESYPPIISTSSSSTGNPEQAEAV
jgi:hypothetical protein